jgi:uncharacterized protein (TIRG00374 family)
MIRKIVYAIVLVLLAYFVFTNLDEVRLIIHTISRANGFWLLGTFGLQAIWLVVIAFNGKSCYRLVGVEETISHFIPLAAAANFVNIVAPSYGAGALAVFLYDGHQRGKPAARISTAAFLYIVYDYAALLFMVVPAIAILHTRGALDTIVFGAAMFVMSVALILLFLTALGIRSVDQMIRAALGMVDLINRVMRSLFHRDIIKKRRVRNFLTDLAEGLTHVHRTPKDVILPFVLSLLRHLLLMSILLLVSFAFHSPFDLGTLVASYGISVVFTIASVTPSGVGFVEGAMGLTQNALGIDPLASAAIAIVYRGITFWSVLFYGVFAIRWVGYTIENAKLNANGEENGNGENTFIPSTQKAAANPGSNPLPASKDAETDFEPTALHAPHTPDLP